MLFISMRKLSVLIREVDFASRGSDRPLKRGQANEYLMRIEREDNR